jgi:hypothetical protein
MVAMGNARRWPQRSRTLADRATNDAPYDSRYDMDISRPTLHTLGRGKLWVLMALQDLPGHASCRRHLLKSHSTRFLAHLPSHSTSRYFKQ